MSAATKRNLLLCLESLEPDLRTAAERAARRAGMGLDDWIVHRLRDRAARGSETRPRLVRSATVLEPGGRRPAAEPASDDTLERMPAALGRGKAQSRRGRTDLVALRDTVEEIRLALKNPRQDRRDPETVRRLRSILAKLEALEEGRPSVDLSAAARRIEDAAGRLSELAQLPQEATAAVARQVEDLARCLEAVAKRVESRDELGSVTRLLETLHARLEERERAGPGLLDRVERLTAKLDRMAQDYGSTLARADERLFATASAQVSDHSAALESLAERVDAQLREAASGNEERLKPIEAMLRAVVERLGQAGGPDAGAGTLEALERQVSRLARLVGEAPADEDPSLAALQRAMGDLLARIAALGGGTLEAVERAAKAAIADALGRFPLHGAPEIGFIRDDLDDLRSRVSAADSRVQDVLEAVHRTLEAVAPRLAPPEGVLVAELPPPGAAGEILSEPSPDETGLIRLGATTAPAVPALPDEKARSLAASDADVPPEPSSEGPHRSLRAPDHPGAADPAVNDIKAGLIAAARRAAQAAAAEAAADQPGEIRPWLEEPLAAAGDDSPRSPRARLRSAVERHRRPLILGLAALVLAIGALQIGYRAVKETGTAVAVPPFLEPKSPTPRPPSETRPASPVGPDRPDGARKVEAPTGRKAPAFPGPEDIADTLAPLPVGEWTHAGPRPKKATGARA